MWRILVALSILLYLLTIADMVRAASCPGGRSIPVVSWLMNHIDGALVNERPVIEQDRLNDILLLTGRPVSWNGYNTPSPFGEFYYPQNGHWRSMYLLVVDGNRFELWFWHSDVALTDRVLAFMFEDMQYSDAHHYGQHHFCMANVALADLERIESGIQ